MISPAVSSSFIERLTVMELRDRTVAMAVTGKQTNRIPFSSSCPCLLYTSYAPNFTKEYNKDICEELGIEVPDDYVAIGEAAEETAK